MIDRMKIARHLKEVRQRKKWRQEDVAERMGGTADKTTVHKLETMKRDDLPLGLLEQWATALGVRVEVLLWEGVTGRGGLAELAGELGPEDNDLLRVAAATFPHMTPGEKAALRHNLEYYRARRG